MEIKAICMFYGGFMNQTTAPKATKTSPSSA